MRVAFAWKFLQWMTVEKTQHEKSDWIKIYNWKQSLFKKRSWIQYTGLNLSIQRRMILLSRIHCNGLSGLETKKKFRKVCSHWILATMHLEYDQINSDSKVFGFISFHFIFIQLSLSCGWDGKNSTFYFHLYRRSINILCKVET